MIHAHAPHATILANTGLPFLPISPKRRSSGTSRACRSSCRAPRGSRRRSATRRRASWAVLLKNHGLIVAGRSLRRAADMVEIIERTAEVILGCYAVGREPPVLPEEAVRNCARWATSSPERRRVRERRAVGLPLLLDQRDLDQPLMRVGGFAAVGGATHALRRWRGLPRIFTLPRSEASTSPLWGSAGAGVEAAALGDGAEWKEALGSP